MNRPLDCLCCIGLGLLLAGCGAQAIRKEAQAEMREGHYEQAIQRLEQGVTRYPDSPLLRSSLLQSRAEAVARWIAESSRLRQAGRLDEAEALLRRALGVDPQNERLRVLQDEVAAERRVAHLLETANQLAQAERREAALQVVDQALKEVPRHTTAILLRRRLEAELRLATGSSLQLAATPPITVDFRAAPLASVLEAIARGTGINFVLDRDVKQEGRVTAFLRSASVADAIDLIGGAHQLARRIIDPHTVLLYPNTPEKHREHQEQIVRVFHLANADAKGTAQLLRSMLRLKDPFVDERGNMVAIRESPDVVAMAERLVALHDASDAEVMLEVDILEVKSSRLTELGITVPNGLTLTPLGPAVRTDGGTATGTTTTPGTSSGLTLRGLRDINSERIGVSVGGIVLSLRREVGDFNILANPRIRAKNREKARIVIGDRFPVVTSTANATGFVSESISYLDVGLKLDVEPIVSLDDDVTIKLALEVSAIAGSLRTAGGSIAYQVGTRNATTTLRLRDGETQVLAGLISNDDRTTANRIPGLGDLPIAGRLFSNQTDDFQRTELMLAITPRVLRSAFRPDPSQSELWIGTENLPRLRTAPRAASPPADVGRIAGLVPTRAAVVPVDHEPSQASAVSAKAGAPEASAPPAEAPPSARLHWPTPSAASDGSIRVSLHLHSPQPLRGATVDLRFDPQQVEVLEVAEGDFFRAGGATTQFTHRLEATEGRLSAGVLRNAEGAAAGEAALLEFRVRRKSPGPATIEVAALRPIGSEAQVAAATDQPALRLPPEQ